MSVARFQSTLGPWFERFVALKQAQGASFQSQAAILGRFDDYLLGRIDHPDQLDGSRLIDFISSMAHLGARSRENIVSVLWPAVAHAIRHGASCPPLPERPRFPRSVSRSPYIYSDEEISRILGAALHLGPAGSLRPHTYATLFALLVTTGLRLGEGRSLSIGDIDFQRAVLEVRKGKFRKDRQIPLHETTVAGLARYDEMRRLAGYCSVPGSPFFVSRKRNRPSVPAAEQAFRTCLRVAGVRDAGGRFPRVHDLRHTFAVRRVVAWYRAGVDVNQRLWALATYLGHVNVNYTLTYLRPNGPMLEEAARRFAASCPISMAEFTEVQL